MKTLVAIGTVLIVPIVLPLLLAQSPANAPPPTPQVAPPVAIPGQVLPTLAPLVESVKAAVVNVDVQSRGHGSFRDDRADEMYERFFGRRPERDEPVRQALGSGFIIDPKGLVLTNNHVVQDSVAIRVRLDDGRAFDGEVLGRDPLTDIAVVKLKGKVENLPSVRLGDSDALRPGDWALAIGNPFGLASSVSLGIISAKARQIGAGPYDDFIQTDAAINPGNSGGPLFNLKGEVIGINTAIVGNGSGIGFAVPSNLAKALVPQLESEGVVSRGFLGVNIQNLSPAIAQAMGVPVSEGAIVLSMTSESPAKQAGLMPDDVVVAIDGDKISSGDSLTRIVALKRPGSVSHLTYYRGAKKLDAKVTLGTRPDLEQIGLPARGGGALRADDGDQQKVGIAFQDVDPRIAAQARLPEKGALITEVVPGSPAEKADLARGMVVVEANRQPVRSAADLLKAIRGARSGASLLLRVRAPGAEAASLRVLDVP